MSCRRLPVTLQSSSRGNSQTSEAKKSSQRAQKELKKSSEPKVQELQQGLKLAQRSFAKVEDLQQEATHLIRQMV